MFDCKSILRSATPGHSRVLTTLEVTYPRFIHSEIMTHRDRERNSGSSRAIPWPVMCERIQNDPVVPIQWGTEQSGMVAGAPLADLNLIRLAEQIWLEARDDAIKHAKRLHNIGATLNKEYPDLACNAYEDVKIHKSLPNRITEPWMWITVVMTATEWKNLFRQRCHPDAEVHFQKIAYMMRDAIIESPVQVLQAGEYHLPYTDAEDREAVAAAIGRELPFLHPDDTSKIIKGKTIIEYLKRVSVARCARVSYVQHGEKKRNVIADAKLWERLRQGSDFGHWSPFGHIASAAWTETRSGPFIGWDQFRKEFANENAEG